MYSYIAYGLGIHSQIPLPDLLPTDEDISKDVVIRVQKLDISERNASPNNSDCLGVAEGVATFRILDGNQIIVEPVPGVEQALLSVTLLGPAMALLLRQRGFAVLHASGVTLNDNTVVFLGQSGWGKSTLAQAFYLRGYSVVSDDVMAVRLDESCPQVLPSYPSIKLFPNVSGVLGCEATATHRVHSQTEKRVHNVVTGFSKGAKPLKRMYVLAGGQRSEIEPLKPQEVFAELVRYSRAQTLLQDAELRKTHLRQCTKLAAAVPAFRLRRPRDLTALPEVVELVENDLAQCT